MTTSYPHYKRACWSASKIDGYFKYLQQAFQCKDRLDRDKKPYQMLLTFEEWWALWQESGHWVERGRCIGQYRMMRLNGRGNYSIGNVVIQLHERSAKQKKSPRACTLKSQCPRCGKTGNRPAMARWHFNRCTAM